MFNNLILAKGIFSQFRPEAFVSNLKYMLSGMIAIFIVIGVIILSTMLINKIFSSKKAPQKVLFAFTDLFLYLSHQNHFNVNIVCCCSNSVKIRICCFNLSFRHR